MNPDVIFTVSDLNRYIKGLLESEEALRDVWVRGEISNFKHHTSGHMYFTLKDDSASLSCVMFRRHAREVRFRPERGMGILVRGYVSLFERAGQYQVYVREMEPEGVGALHLAFEQLKRRLEQEGLFDASHKKDLPILPRRVGVVTSPTGAAFRDICQVSARRFPGRRIILAPARVQGEGASEEIARALGLLDESGLVDVIIMGRGGGSLEDLWPFNEEDLARAIFAAHTPVISAVGHETDFTISDFVADVRAPTPSAAAELAVPSQAQILEVLQGLRARMSSACLRRLDREKSALRSLGRSQFFRRPEDLTREKSQSLDHIKTRLEGLTGELLLKGKHRFGTAAARLDDLSPLGILRRGYSITRSHPEGQVIKEASQAPEGSQVEVILHRGRLLCLVQESRPDGGEEADHERPAE